MCGPRITSAGKSLNVLARLYPREADTHSVGQAVQRRRGEDAGLRRPGLAVSVRGVPPVDVLLACAEPVHVEPQIPGASDPEGLRVRPRRLVGPAILRSPVQGYRRVPIADKRAVEPGRGIRDVSGGQTVNVQASNRHTDGTVRPGVIHHFRRKHVAPGVREPSDCHFVRPRCHTAHAPCPFKEFHSPDAAYDQFLIDQSFETDRETEPGRMSPAPV